jgi:UDP-N-acetylmuramate dehydrogenase
MEIKRVLLKEYSSLRVGGEGDLVVVRSIKELVRAVMFGKKEGKVVCPLGEGTNTYFGENLSQYLFIKNEIKGISFDEQGDFVFLTVGAGEKWDDIVSFSVEKELWGIENLSFIPGTVGAAPVQNIGAYGSELKDVLVSLSAYDTKTSNTVEIANDACAFGYRESFFKQEKRYIIMSLTLKLSRDAKPILTYKPLDSLVGKENLKVGDVRALVIATRQAKLPDYKEYPNAGSFFKNPIVTGEQGKALLAKYPAIPLIPHTEGYKIPSAWLIEHIAHMKGVRVGDVGMWPNQPLVLVNYGDAQVIDISIFTESITEKIKEKTGIFVEREVNFIS